MVIVITDCIRLCHFGYGASTTVAYVICVSVEGPALIDLDLQPLLVHLFVFSLHCYQQLPRQYVAESLLQPVW